MQPTQEQQAIVKALSSTQDSLMVTAYAGCAKTTTLTLLAAEQQHIAPNSKGLALAFNVRIKKELESRFPPNFTCYTLNSLGHRVWGSTLGRRLTLDSDKLTRLVNAVCQDNKTKELWSDIKAMVIHGMNAGIVPKGFPDKGLLEDTPEAWADLADEHDRPVAAIPFARRILETSVKEAFKGLISFDDQIYMSALFSSASSWPKFDIVMVDEAQDLSPLNHLQISKFRNCRLIVVGDPKQAIYAWRGADSESMATIKSLRPHWTDLSLTTTFRCPKVIVQRQQGHAPGFTAAPAAPEGDITFWEDWSLDKLPTFSTAIICRNNAPLFSMATKLMRAKRGFTMLGNDLGKNLINLSKRICPLGDTPSETFAGEVIKWAEREIAAATAKGKLHRIPGIEDRAECLVALAEECKSAQEIWTTLTQMYSSPTPTLVLSTGHRAKGLEWEHVVFLDPWRVPSKFAVESESPKQLEQEYNIRYVIETRAKKHLIFANMEGLQQ